MAHSLEQTNEPLENGAQQIVQGGATEAVDETPSLTLAAKKKAQRAQSRRRSLEQTNERLASDSQQVAHSLEQTNEPLENGAQQILRGGAAEAVDETPSLTLEKEGTESRRERGR